MNQPPRPTTLGFPRRRLAAFIGSLLGVVSLGAIGPPDPSADTIVVHRCLIEYEHDSEVGAATAGMIGECRVSPGAKVKAGQLLGRLFDEDVHAEMSLHEAEANSDIEIRLAQAEHALAASKAKRTASLWKRNAASEEELNQDRILATAASVAVEKAKHLRRIASIQLDQTKAMLKTREFVSPHDGVVTAVLRKKGEIVALRDPVFHVVDIDLLKVITQVDVSDVWRLRVGQPARVIPEVAGADLAIEQETFPGKITFIDSRIDPELRTCLIHVVAENREHLLRSGLEARVEIDADESTPAREVAPPPAPVPETTRSTRPHRSSSLIENQLVKRAHEDSK